MGFNVITVGSTDGEKNVAYNSCWKVPNVDEINDPDATTNYYYLKPTLVAPGENIVIPNVYDDGINGLKRVKYVNINEYISISKGKLFDYILCFLILR